MAKPWRSSSVISNRSGAFLSIRRSTASPSGWPTKEICEPKDPPCLRNLAKVAQLRLLRRGAPGERKRPLLPVWLPPDRSNVSPHPNAVAAAVGGAEEGTGAREHRRLGRLKPTIRSPRRPRKRLRRTSLLVSVPSRGPVAHLVERRHGMAKATGSIPVGSTEPDSAPTRGGTRLLGMISSRLITRISLMSFRRSAFLG